MHCWMVLNPHLLACCHALWFILLVLVRRNSWESFFAIRA